MLRDSVRVMVEGKKEPGALVEAQPETSQEERRLPA